jgi:hypothetical protein
MKSSIAIEKTEPMEATKDAFTLGVRYSSIESPNIMLVI